MKWEAPLALALFLFSVYLLTFDGSLHIVDEVSMMAVTENLVKRGKLDTDQIAWIQWTNSPGEVLGAWGKGGHVYSKKGGAPGFLAAPLYALAWRARGLGWGQVQTTMLFNSLVTAATGVLVHAYGRRLGYGARPAATAGLLFGLATIAWPYAKSFFGEPLSTLGILGAAYTLLRWRKSGQWPEALLAGLSLGLAVATTTVNLMLTLPLGVYLVTARKPAGWPGDRPEPSPGEKQRVGFALACFAAGLGVGLAFVGWYNWARFGLPFESGYHFAAGEGFTNPLWKGAYGLLLSPYRGFVWYTPLTFVAFGAAPRFYRRHRAESLLFAGIALIYLLVFSSWWMWWAGYAWGPRFLVPLASFVALTLLPVLESWPQLPWIKRAAIVTTIVISVAVQVLAASMDYATYETRLRQIFPTAWDDPLRYDPPALYTPLYSPILGQLRLWSQTEADLAWLRGQQPDFVAVTVLLAMVSLTAAAFFRTIRTTETAGPHRSPGSWVVVLALVFCAVGTGSVLHRFAADPRYGEPGRGYRAALEALERAASPNDAIVTVTPYSYHIPMNHHRGQQPVLGLALEYPTLHPQTEALLRQMAAEHPQLWLITQGLQPADPRNGVERWLSTTAFQATDVWYEDVRLVRYAASQPATGLIWQPLAVEFEDGITLTAASWPASASPGRVFPLLLRWEATAIPSASYTVFAQLLDEHGRLHAQRDSIPCAGYAPTNQWQPGDVLHDHLGLALPADMPPGQYRLIAGLYKARTGERLQVRASDQAATEWLLGQVRVEP